MASPPRKVLLVEPWFAGSHRAWAEGLQEHSRHHIELLSREPGGWRRTFDRAAAELGGAVGRAPDVLLASSMMDLGVFVEASGLHGVPTLLYLHENQLTYDRVRPDLARGAVNWRSVASADRVAFNSRFHFEDFFSALPLLGVAEDAIATRRAGALVLPVGISPGAVMDSEAHEPGPPALLWNHRWETDKDPAAFVSAIEELAGLPFRLILLGNGRDTGQHRARLQSRFAERVVYSGHASPADYPALVGQADIVISTARQEFFGVSVAEAMAAGAVPLVPDRLAYPELLGPQLAAVCTYADGELAARLGEILSEPARHLSLRPAARTAGRRFDWRRVGPRYDAVIDSMV